MGTRSTVLAVLIGLFSAAGLVACVAPDPAEETKLDLERGPSAASGLDAVLRDVCGDATEINTLVRLPDMLITGMDPSGETISADAWLASVKEAKERAVDLLRMDPGIWNREIVDFATAVIAVPETPPTAPLPAEWHAPLTTATAGLAAACEEIAMPIGLIVPPSFGG